MLKFVYSAFLAILVALFVGLGVQAFYPAPKYPEYPTGLEFKGDPSNYTEEQKAQVEKYEKESKEVREKDKPYSRNASIILISASILLLILSLTLLHNFAFVSDGILLGGILTLLYGIGRGFASDNDKFRFIIVTIGLAIALLLGYVRFAKPDKEKS